MLILAGLIGKFIGLLGGAIFLGLWWLVEWLLRKNTSVPNGDNQTPATNAVVANSDTSNETPPLQAAIKQDDFLARPEMPTLPEVDAERVYALVSEEIETGKQDKGLWARLFVECDGVETQVKVRYIKERAARLIAQEQEHLQIQKQENSQRDLISIEKEKLKQEAESKARLKQEELEHATHLEEARKKKQLEDEERRNHELMQSVFTQLRRKPADPKLLSAVSTGDLSEAKRLLEAGTSLEGYDQNGLTVNEIAKRNANFQMVDLLKRWKRD